MYIKLVIEADMDTESQIYRDLQIHLDKLPIGFPPTESGVEIRILKHLFTPEEAKLAMQLSMIPETLESIYQRVKDSGISITELEQTLGRMMRKGAISASIKNGKGLYRIIPFVVGMYERQLKHLTK